MIVSRPLARARAHRAPRRSTWNTLGTVAALLAASVATAHAAPPSAQAPGAEAPATLSAPSTLPPGAAPATTPAAAMPPTGAPAPATPPSSPPAALGADAESTGAATEDTLRAALSHWGCLPSDLLAVEQRWYAACGAGGVLVVEQREGAVLVLTERRPVPGRAHALFVRAGSIWVESTRIEAHPLEEFAASATGPSAAGNPSARALSLSPLPGQTPRANVRGPTYSKLAPPRIGRLLTVEGGIRPYLPMRSLGVALLADAAVTYHGERAWYVQGQLHPLGATATKGDDASVFGASLSGGYDHPYFGVGLGLGTLRRSQFHSDFDPIQRRTRDWVEHSFGLSVTQALRLGALDGLSLALDTAFVLDDERWRFGYFDLTFQIPLNGQTWLLASGGGAREAGYLYAEVGLRRLIRGDLGSGSLFVEPSVGVAGIDNRLDGVGPGPMIGCHLEWRK
jgi:hypothetical protein